MWTAVTGGISRNLQTLLPGFRTSAKILLLPNLQNEGKTRQYGDNKRREGGKGRPDGGETAENNGFDCSQNLRAKCFKIVLNYVFLDIRQRGH